MASSLWRIPVLVLLMAGGARGRGDEEPLPEYQVKAMYLCRIAALVEYPNREVGTYKVGVLGSSPFRRDLHKLMDAQTVRGLPIQVKYGRRIEELLDCQLVFICESEEYLIEDILVPLRGRPILTVSDSQAAALKGVMVSFFYDRRRVGLEVNLEAVRGGKLALSSYLLKIAKVVR